MKTVVLNLAGVNSRQILPSLAAMLMALTFVSAGQAAVITSTPGGGDWYSPSTWVGGVVPQPTDDAILVSYIGYSAAVTVNNLTVEAGFYNGSAVTVNGNLTLSGSFTLQEGANISVGGNLEIGSGCTFDPSGYNITVTGTTTVDGLLHDLWGGQGSNTFNGNLVIDPGGTWDLTDVNEWYLGGQLINNGSIPPHTGSYTFIGSGGGGGTITPPTAPVLSISNSGGVLTFTWDAVDFPNYYLVGQTNSSGGLTPNNWVAVPGGNVSPTSFPVPAGDSAFFRLSDQ